MKTFNAIIKVDLFMQQSVKEIYYIIREPTRNCHSAFGSRNPNKLTCEEKKNKENEREKKKRNRLICALLQ